MNGENDDGGFTSAASGRSGDLRPPDGGLRLGFGLGLGPAAKEGGRRRLVALLREIAELAGERSLERCPYRTARDVCTFRGECGNRYRAVGGKALCTGGELNARGASDEEVAAALEAAGVAFAPAPDATEDGGSIGKADE